MNRPRLSPFDPLLYLTLDLLLYLTLDVLDVRMTTWWFPPGPLFVALPSRQYRGVRDVFEVLCLSWSEVEERWRTRPPLYQVGIESTV